MSSQTLGVEFCSQVVRAGTHTVKLQLWDTAGTERFRALTRSYYRGAAGIVLVYDITTRETFTELDQWLTDARRLASPQVLVILVGNKTDLNESAREVSTEEAARWASSKNVLFIEASAKDGTNVEDIFLKLARLMVSMIELGQLDPHSSVSGIQLGDDTFLTANPNNLTTKRANNWLSKTRQNTDARNMNLYTNSCNC